MAGGIPEGGDESCEPEAREVALDAIEVVHQQKHHLHTARRQQKAFRVDKTRCRREKLANRWVGTDLAGGGEGEEAALEDSSAVLPVGDLPVDPWLAPLLHTF